jgi:hypothetical protein
MSIPIATTTITILRSDQDGETDAYDGVTYSTHRSGVRAVIGAPSGSETNAGGSSEQQGARLNCDTVDLRHDDRVYDERSHVTYEVTFTARRYGVGLDHTVADELGTSRTRPQPFLRPALRSA